mmetsp:Transcript_54822/g.97567  ORF Transcript_54822/g.97567 Transcript_54822/m.97567 type:complete len:679 (-) Transcript_54822:138-2174(-)
MGVREGDAPQTNRLDLGHQCAQVKAHRPQQFGVAGVGHRKGPHDVGRRKGRVKVDRLDHPLGHHIVELRGPDSQPGKAPNRLGHQHGVHLVHQPVRAHQPEGDLLHQVQVQHPEAPQRPGQDGQAPGGLGLDDVPGLDLQGEGLGQLPVRGLEPPERPQQLHALVAGQAPQDPGLVEHVPLQLRHQLGVVVLRAGQGPRDVRGGLRVEPVRRQPLQDLGLQRHEEAGNPVLELGVRPQHLGDALGVEGGQDGGGQGPVLQGLQERGVPVVELREGPGHAGDAPGRDADVPPREDLALLLPQDGGDRLHDRPVVDLQRGAGPEQVHEAVRVGAVQDLGVDGPLGEQGQDQGLAVAELGVGPHDGVDPDAVQLVDDLRLQEPRRNGRQEVGISDLELASGPGKLGDGLAVQLGGEPLVRQSLDEGVGEPVTPAGNLCGGPQHVHHLRPAELVEDLLLQGPGPQGHEGGHHRIDHLALEGPLAAHQPGQLELGRGDGLRVHKGDGLQNGPVKAGQGALHPAGVFHADGGGGRGGPCEHEGRHRLPDDTGSVLLGPPEALHTAVQQLFPLPVRPLRGADDVLELETFVQTGLPSHDPPGEPTRPVRSVLDRSLGPFGAAFTPLRGRLLAGHRRRQRLQGLEPRGAEGGGEALPRDRCSGSVCRERGLGGGCDHGPERTEGYE